MSDYTPEPVADLITEARDLIAHTKTYNFGMWSADKLAHEVAGELADALEAVSAEVERLHAVMGRGFIKVLSDRDEAYREMHAREMHHFEEEQARAKAEAERDEALAVIQSAYNAWHMESRQRAIDILREALSRIPEHPKED